MAKRKGGYHHSAKEHRIFNLFRRKGYSVSHAWAATEGFAPKSIRKSHVFKTTTRQYSITHKRAAISRKLHARARKLATGSSRKRY